MDAETQPLSEDVSLKSHSAEGSKNDTHRISMASLALANPQTNVNLMSMLWNFFFGVIDEEAK
jgi:hypothetical protein